MYIGGITAVVGDVAAVFGCSLGLSDMVTAITFVAMGTSLPDTFASGQAARESKTADAALGNITGSNAVNVFLGLGLPWVIATHYYDNEGTTYSVPAGGIGYSVTIFSICSCTCLAILFAREIFGEGIIGGPPLNKNLNGALFVSLWGVYLILSIINA